MRRLGIFIFFDPQGIVDDYIEYLLREMQSVCTEIVTICNGKLTEEGKKKISAYSKTIFCRRNQGMDAGALKDYFVNLENRKYWSSFEELVWFNDTCYGPLYSMQNVFFKMEQRKPCDFWGITVHAKSNARWPGSNHDGIAEHLQSYFIVIKRQLLQDDRFFEFWKNIEVSNNFNATVANYELAMTQTFASWGYIYDAFCDTREKDNNPDAICNLTAEAMYLLVSRYECPFIKRKDFVRTNAEALVHTNGEQVLRTMQYIRKNTQYDARLIYQNLMRRYDQRLWHRNLCHDFILSSDYSPEKDRPKALILAELNYEDTVSELCENIDALPKNCSLAVVTNNESLVPAIKENLMPTQLVVEKTKKSGLAQIFMLLKELQVEQYEFFCILQEMWGSPQNRLHLPESGQRYTLYGNLVKGSSFIPNVIDTFQKNPMLGILQPAMFPQDYNDFHDSCNLKELATEYNVPLPIWADEKPITVKPSFWCRKEVVLAVFENIGSRLPEMKDGELESLLNYIAIGKTLYTGNVLEQSQASCLFESQQQLFENSYTDVDFLKWLQYRRMMQKAAAINSGRIRPENAGITSAMLRRLLWATIIYYVEKKLRHDSVSQKKDTFFLGVRDVYEAYRKVRNA